MLSKFFNFFIPKNQAFYDLYNQSAANNVEMSELLYKVVRGERADEEKMQHIKIDRLKAKGNDIKHKVYLASAKALISPFERNDMYALASALNAVCDHIHIASRRINMYQADHITVAVNELSGLVLETAVELNDSVAGLCDLKNADAINQRCKKIKDLEYHADQVYGKAVSSIMMNEKSSVELIKYTEILAALEKTTDRCEDATNVIQTIIVKNT